MPSLFDPLRIGRLTRPNRIIMAPLTRGRTGGTGIPDALVAEYYAQRASAGLLIAEATAVNRAGDGWPGAPGLYSDAQASGWRAVADAVHAAGGRIFVQLWHMGRAVLAQDLDGARPLAPSEIAATGEHRGKDGIRRPFAGPRAMTQDDIDRTVADFTRAAERAVTAGLDGVEIHAANNYLIDTFLRNGTNRRDDAFGGTSENRARFLIEIVDSDRKVVTADYVCRRRIEWRAYEPRQCPRHGDVDDRAEEEEDDELGKTALHGIILRRIVPSPAAFGADRCVTKEHISTLSTRFSHHLFELQLGWLDYSTSPEIKAHREATCECS